jgi:hypothetical protein
MGAQRLDRKTLIISRSERVGEWFRMLLGGGEARGTITLVADLAKGLRELKRCPPGIVVFVAEGPKKRDDQLRLLQALLVTGKRSRSNTLVILYDLADGEMTMYHRIPVAYASGRDVADAVRKAPQCPLFGYCEEAVTEFPQDCGLLPLMAKSEALAAKVAGREGRLSQLKAHSG